MYQQSGRTPVCHEEITMTSNNSGKDGGKDSGKSGGRGFAGMDEEKQREIASKGGHAAHEKGTAHEFDSEEAREAGRKGGEAVSQDREHMAEIGRRGGEASGQNRSQGGGGQGGKNR
jgi:general stress protein YciG